MATVYRIIEHKEHPSRERTLDISVGGKLRDHRSHVYAEENGVSELYRGEIKPTVLQVKPYDFEPLAIFNMPILVFCEGQWWLTDNPQDEFGSHIDWYIELPELPNPEA